MQLLQRFWVILVLAALAIPVASAESFTRERLLQRFEAAKAEQISTNSTIGMKVWVQASDTEGLPNGPYLNLATKEWSPGESFFLCVEAARPLHLYLFSIAEGEAAVCFSPQKRFPGTSVPAKPGKVWVSPRIVLDDDYKSESLAVFAIDTPTCLREAGIAEQVVGDPTSIDVSVVVDIVGSGPSKAEATAVVKSFDSTEALEIAHFTRTLFHQTKEIGAKLQPHLTKAIYGKTKMLYANGVEDAKSGSADEVCTIAVSPHPVGHLRLEFEKSKQPSK